VIASHGRVAERYGVPSIDLALEVTERIDAGEFTWEGDFKDLHPSPFGMKVYARSIERLFDAAWKSSADGLVRAHPLPPPIDEHSYFRGRLVDIAKVQGWHIERDWTPRDKVATRPGFVHVPMLTNESPGEEARLRFEGTAVGVFVAAGPDAGVLEFRIDGGPWRKQNLLTSWSKSLHIPWAYVLDGDLEAGRHELVMRMADGAARIVAMLAN
jgi:hypothetical protein